MPTHPPADVPGFIPLQYTPLISSASHPFYYNVKMLSLAVDGQLLPVSQVRLAHRRGAVRQGSGASGSAETRPPYLRALALLIQTPSAPSTSCGTAPPPSPLQSLFDQGYGTVLDSGTTFTYMPTPVFQAFANGELCCAEPGWAEWWGAACWGERRALRVAFCVPHALAALGRRRTRF